MTTEKMDVQIISNDAVTKSSYMTNLVGNAFNPCVAKYSIHGNCI